MNTPLRILIIEDSQNDALLLVRKLKQEGGYEPVYNRVDTLEDFTEALSEREWDIIISDHSMPHFSAIAALQTLRDKKLDIPLIIVSGTIEPATAVAAMKAGASDFIMKGDLTRLIPAIERELREAESRRARRKVEEQFLQTQKLDSIGRLAGGIAHDFNNILTAILGYAQFLKSGIEAGSPKIEDAEEIIGAADRATGLTRQLLAFSRRQVLKPTVLNLNALVQNMEKMLRRVIGEDISMATNLSPSLGSVKADAGQIEQVIVNLVVNARDAMPHGGTLTLETMNTELDEGYTKKHPGATPGRHVLLAVSDTGMGMEEATQARVFEPFFTTKESGKGTGLGLSTAYGIVKQSGGHIWFFSALGRGTSFKIYFPIVDQVADKPEDKKNPVIKNGSETILFVEDDPIVLGIARRVLAENGYHTLEARSGREAERLCREFNKPLDLLVTDMVMPGMDGLELAKRITALRPNIKILYISGYTDKAIFRQELFAPGTHYLQKPFTPFTLAQKIREALDQPAKQGPAA